MTELNKNKLLRKLPSVDEILNKPEICRFSDKFSRTITLRAVQSILAEKRSSIMSTKEPVTCVTKFQLSIRPEEIEKKINTLRQPSLKQVINATGIIVHTNLGRAPLSDAAVKAVCKAASHYSNLEYDINEGHRGLRYSHITSLLKELTGAEDGLVVNNNAAAVLLCLNTLAKDRQVIISRGELVEIGGSFRIPDIMNQSGAILVEVGTTNRTHPSDYTRAINDQTALILKVHRSNYKTVGFSSEVDLPELNQLGRENNIPVMFDMGSGNLVNASLLGLSDEPTVQDAVKAGTDITTFSGDKLLGGPQAGLIAGKNHFISRITENPLTRALRIDKLTLAALEATLRNYALNPEDIDSIPVIRMLVMSESLLKKRARKIVKAIQGLIPSLNISIDRDSSRVGGGAYPLHDIPTWVVSIDPTPLGVNEFEQLLRTAPIPLIARISKDRIILDMRTIMPDEVSMIPGCIAEVTESAKLPV